MKIEHAFELPIRVEHIKLLLNMGVYVEAYEELALSGDNKIIYADDKSEIDTTRVDILIKYDDYNEDINTIVKLIDTFCDYKTVRYDVMRMIQEWEEDLQPLDSFLK